MNNALSDSQRRLPELLRALVLVKDKFFQLIPCWLVERMYEIPVSAVLHLLGWHGDEKTGRAFYHLHIPDDKTVVKLDGHISLELVIPIHRQYLDLSDTHYSSSLFDVSFLWTTLKR